MFLASDAASFVNGHDRRGRRLPGERGEPVSFAKAGHYRWVVCALLFFATTVNYIDRQILSLIRDPRRSSAGRTSPSAGSTGPFTSPTGSACCSLVGSSTGTARRSATPPPSSRGASPRSATRSSARSPGSSPRGGPRRERGGNFPSAIKAIALWFPKNERAFATSIFNAGTNMGAIIAPAMIPAIAITFGWRWTFILAGVAGFVWLFFWFPMYDVPEKLQEPDPGRVRSHPQRQGRGRHRGPADGQRPRPEAAADLVVPHREVPDRPRLVVLPDLAARTTSTPPAASASSTAGSTSSPSTRS